MYDSMAPYGLARNDGVREAVNVKEETVSGIENLSSLLLRNSDASALIAVSPFTGFHQVGTAPHSHGGLPAVDIGKVYFRGKERTSTRQEAPSGPPTRSTRSAWCRGVGVPECLPNECTPSLCRREVNWHER